MLVKLVRLIRGALIWGGVIIACIFLALGSTFNKKPLLVKTAFISALIVALFGGNYIYKRSAPQDCKSVGRVLTDLEVILNFIQSRIDQRWLTPVYGNGADPSIGLVKLQQHHPDWEFSAFTSAKEYVAMIPDCCLLGMTVTEVNNWPVFVARELLPHNSVGYAIRSVPWRFRDRVRDEILYVHAIKVKKPGSEWEPYFFDNPEDENYTGKDKYFGHIYWSEWWVGHCGEQIGIPIKYIVG